MKVLSKILNFVVVILVCIGIYATAYYFTAHQEWKEEYKELQERQNELNKIIDNNHKKLISLRNEINTKDKEIKQSENNIDSLKGVIETIIADHKQEIEELENYTLEEALTYILDYYDTDSTEAFITVQNDSILVTIRPRLIHEWTYTIEKLKSRDVEVSGYRKQISEYDILVDRLTHKVGLLESRDSLHVSTIDALDDKNNMFQKLIENRDKQIKSLKIQRNVAGGVAIAVIILCLL